MIFRNSLAISGAMISGYIFSFILAPVMLSRLGLALFGVWAVTGAFATYASLMDLGIRRAIERFVAFYDAKDDRRSVEQLFGLGLIAVTIVAAIATLIAAVAAPLVAKLLGDLLSASDMRIVLLCAVAIMVLNAYGSVMRAIPIGLQQMVPPSLAQTAGNLLNFGFSLTALILSRDLVVYALANVAAALLAMVPTAIALRHVWSPVRVRFPSRALVKEVLGFSINAQVSWVAELVHNQTDKIILALFIDVRAAGAYEIANRVVLAVKAVSILSISALTSASTAQITREGRQIIPAFYERYTQRSLSVALPLLLFTCASAPVLLTGWLGDVPESAIAVVILLTLANCATLSSGTATTVSLGDGRAGPVARVSVQGVILNIVFTLILTPFLGLWGVVLGTALALVCGAAIFLFGFHRHYGIPVATYLRAAGPPAAIALLAALPVAAWLAVGGASFEERLPALLAAVACLGAYLAIYWPLATRANILPERLNLPRMRLSRA